DEEDTDIITEPQLIINTDSTGYNKFPDYNYENWWANDYPTPADETTTFKFEFQVPKSNNVELGGFYNNLPNAKIINEIQLADVDYNILIFTIDLGQERNVQDPTFYRYDIENDEMRVYHFMESGWDYDSYERDQDDYRENIENTVNVFDSAGALVDQA